MNNFFTAFQKELTHAVHTDFTELVQQFKSETIYAIALVTDSDAGTVYMAVNTEEGLQRKIEHYKREGYPDTETRRATLRWVPDEWTYSDGDLKPSQLAKVSRILMEREDYSEESQSEFYEAATEALQQLDQEGLFIDNALRDQLTLFLSVVDDDRVDAIENYSAKLLNSESVYEQFVKRYDVIS